MMEDKTVEILGTLYTIRFDVPDEKLPKGADGCMDQSVHQIKIAKFESDRDSLMDIDEYRKQVLRHEIVHAFYMNPVCGRTAALLKHGAGMKQSQIGLLFSHRKCLRHSKKQVAYRGEKIDA